MRLERMLEFTHQVYRNRGHADIDKKEVAASFDRARGKIIYKKRSGFDYEGTLLGGRSICLEAKECKEPRLAIDKKGKRGLKIHQIEALLFRGKLGAAVGVVWYHDWDDCYFLDYEFLKHFMEEIYDKPAKKGGRAVKSIGIDLVRKHCMQVMRDGAIEYMGAINGNLDSGEREGVPS
jgi:penicillin-binding protein-related factor A (putative recombinase)